ncbi:MAG TPA: hypothetical protein VGV40_08950 [Solirubrobacteraceae bacterium]|nr:hypothetical protein [Solirubrobacteraceae bacterium]
MTFLRAILTLLTAGLLVACGDTTEQQGSAPPEQRQPPAQTQPPPPTQRQPSPEQPEQPGQPDRDAVARSLEGICARFEQTGGDLVDRVARAVESRDADAAAEQVPAVLAQLQQLVTEVEELPSSPEGQELRDAVQRSLEEDVEATRRLEQSLRDGLEDPRAVAGAFSALSDLTRSRDQLAQLGLAQCA